MVLLSFPGWSDFGHSKRLALTRVVCTLSLKSFTTTSVLSRPSKPLWTWVFRPRLLSSLPLRMLERGSCRGLMDVRTLSQLLGASSQGTRTPTILPELHCTIFLKSHIPDTPWSRQGNGLTLLCNVSLGLFRASNITWSGLDCLCSGVHVRQASRFRPKLHLLLRTEASPHV